MVPCLSSLLVAQGSEHLPNKAPAPNALLFLGEMLKMRLPVLVVVVVVVVVVAHEEFSALCSSIPPSPSGKSGGFGVFLGMGISARGCFRRGFH